jgi:hypothetical protein
LKRTIPGKIPYIKKVLLEISLSSGTMINFEQWIPASKHQSQFGDQYPEPYKELMVQIELDGNIILNTSLDKAVEFSYQFEDSDDSTQHCVAILLSGLDESHCKHLTDIGEVFPMMRVDTFSIESLPMQNVLEDQGRCEYYGSKDVQVPGAFMGQNGKMSLEFSTPIYSWLLAIEKHQNYYKLFPQHD